MLAQIDEICSAVGVWPHAVLSGHAHNYQRFTRTRTGGQQIPYVVCGNGGHNLTSLTKAARRRCAPRRSSRRRAQAKIRSCFENYDDLDYGYLRLIVTAAQLRIEYHPASDGAGAKTPDDSVTVDLADSHARAADSQRPRLAGSAARRAPQAVSVRGA